MSRTITPYTSHDSTESLHNITFEASHAERTLFFSRFRGHGNLNLILAHVFHTVMRATDGYVDGDCTNVTRVLDLIRDRLLEPPLPRTPRPGLQHPYGRPNPRNDEANPRPRSEPRLPSGSDQPRRGQVSRKNPGKGGEGKC